MGEQDPDLNRITEWLTAKGAALAKASADVMPLLERLVVQELIRGHNDEASLSLELLGRFHQDRDLRWQLVEGLPSWWRQNCMRSDKVDARRFLLRSADQVAMFLTFKNFKAIARRSALPLDDILLSRSALGIYRLVKRDGNPTEDE